jgi:hypothetical protein
MLNPPVFGNDFVPLYSASGQSSRDLFRLEHRPARANLSVPNRCIAFVSSRQSIMFVHRDPRPEESHLGLMSREIHKSCFTPFFVRLVEVFLFAYGQVSLMHDGHSKVFLNYPPKFEQRVPKVIDHVMKILPYTARSAMFRSHEHPLFLEV